MKKIKLLLLVCSMVLLHLAASAQTRTITGTVRDSKTGEPISGATVNILHSRIATSADEKGVFRIVVPSSLTKVVLSISGIGYTPIEMTPKGDNVVVSLEIANKQL